MNKLDEQLERGARAEQGVQSLLAIELSLRLEVARQGAKIESDAKVIAALREALVEIRERDDRNGSLPPAYREIIDNGLAAFEQNVEK